MPDARVVPLWRRFKFYSCRCEGGWMFRLFLGVAFISFDYHYEYEWYPAQSTTGLYIGIIPWKVKEGSVLPGKSWIKRVYRMQETLSA